jgi:hypothetical protein
VVFIPLFGEQLKTNHLPMAGTRNRSGNYLHNGRD